MKVVTQEKHINGNIAYYKESDKEDYEYCINVKNGKIPKKEADLDGYGFLFLGPCNQCKKYSEKYVIFTTIDDYCYDTDCYVCTDCMNKAIKLISEY